MKAPAHWSDDPARPSWRTRLFGALTPFWQLGAAFRAWHARPHIAAVPVLCIGNLTAGGAGKSPMVRALRARLAERGVNAHVLSRGYGGKIRGPHLVDPTEDSAADVGDEPMMLAAEGLVWVAHDRAAGADAAAQAGADLVLMDDGFQNPHLHQDAGIVMVDAEQGLGNGRIIPAGPLREDAARGLARADLVVLVGSEPARFAALQQWPMLADAKPLVAEILPQQTGLPMDGVPVVAFAGIGRPEKFFQTLRNLGADLRATHAFGDHEPYAPAIVRRMIAEGRQQGALILTTEKDAVRLPDLLRAEVLTQPIRLELLDWTAVDCLLERLLPDIIDQKSSRSGHDPAQTSG